MTKHGTVSRYVNQKCRCAGCRAAKNAYERRRRVAALNRKVAEHLWTAHGAAFTAKMVDGPEHLHRVCPGLAENHRLEHLAVAQGELRPSWRQHDHDSLAGGQQ